MTILRNKSVSRWVNKLTNRCTNLPTLPIVQPLVFPCTKATLGYLVVQFRGAPSEEAFVCAFSQARVAPFALITVSTAGPPRLVSTDQPAEERRKNAN